MSLTQRILTTTVPSRLDDSQHAVITATMDIHLLVLEELELYGAFKVRLLDTIIFNHRHHHDSLNSRN